MNSNRKKLVFLVAIFGLIILVIFGLGFYQINESGKESCIASLEAFILREIENPQVKNSVPINEKWHILTKQEAQKLLIKAVESKRLDCNNIRYNYEEGNYWGKEFIISMRINESTKKTEIKIEE